MHFLTWQEFWMQNDFKETKVDHKANELLDVKYFWKSVIKTLSLYLQQILYFIFGFGYILMFDTLWCRNSKNKIPWGLQRLKRAPTVSILWKILLPSSSRMFIGLLPSHSLRLTYASLKALGIFVCPLSSPKKISLQSSIEPCFDLLRHFEPPFENSLR